MSANSEWHSLGAQHRNQNAYKRCPSKSARKTCSFQLLAPLSLRIRLLSYSVCLLQTAAKSKKRPKKDYKNGCEFLPVFLPLVRYPPLCLFSHTNLPGVMVPGSFFTRDWPGTQAPPPRLTAPSSPRFAQQLPAATNSLAPSPVASHFVFFFLGFSTIPDKCNLCFVYPCKLSKKALKAPVPLCFDSAVDFPLPSRDISCLSWPATVALSNSHAQWMH